MKSVTMSIHAVDQQIVPGLLTQDASSEPQIERAPSGAFLRVNRKDIPDEGREVLVTLGLEDTDAVAFSMMQAPDSNHVSIQFRNLGLGLKDPASPTQVLHALRVVSEGIGSIKEGGYLNFGNLRDQLGRWLGTDESASLAPAFQAYRR